MGWDLSLTPKVTLHHVSFPLLSQGTALDDRDDVYYMLPWQGGSFVKDAAFATDWYNATANPVERGWEGPGVHYPGFLHAPYLLVCTKDDCVMAASINWASPLSVRPVRNLIGSPKSLRLDFMTACLQGFAIVWCNNQNAFPARETANISIILGSFRSDPVARVQAWQSAILAYRSWLQPHLTQPAVQPAKMLAQHGMFQICLVRSCPGLTPCYTRALVTMCTRSSMHA
jgi:hypothetical protein